MMRVGLAALVLPASAVAAEGVSGYLQQHLAYRSGGEDRCAAVACPAMVNETRAQMLAEWQGGPVGATLRVDALHDEAVDESRLKVREAYLDWSLSHALSLRAGRQVITWGVGDYLFVNDIFPKNYDGFFTGKPFDHMKEAVDALKLNGLVGEVEAELVLAEPRLDDMPLPARYRFASFPDGTRVLRAEASGADVALRIAGKIGRWDAALYAGRYHSRDAGLYMDAPGAGVKWVSAPTRHLGASGTAGVGAGVVMGELAYLSVKPRPGNMNAHFYGERVKSLVGYAREVGTDLSLSLQYHLEHDVDRSRYLDALAPTVTPADRTRRTAYARVAQRLLHHTLGIGAQLFVASDGGKYLNPFTSYSIQDGLNLEAGANWFRGPAGSRYGAMRHDSNVYASLRYSF